MEKQEPLLRSDWCIYRGGMISITCGENINIQRVFLDAPGGNGVFVSGYNQHVQVSGCRIIGAGASGIAFVGHSDTVRSPLYNYHDTKPLEEVDQEKGPKTDNYPRECAVYDNLIEKIGEFEKQTAGVQISMAMDIKVSHNSIYDVPRAGININEGTWGGHIIEYNDVFDTVKETGDHGAFNSWGRDRFWYPDRTITNSYKINYPDMVQWDCLKPTHIRNNRMQCSNGWDIDLDDGSSFYEIYNNLCLTGGIKTREGYHRHVYNNILVNNTIRCGISYDQAGDSYHNNIMYKAYEPSDIPEVYGKRFDNNFLHIDDESVVQGSILQNSSHQDMNSLQGDALFLSPRELNYTVKSDSATLDLGFINISMDEFGVVSEELKRIVKTPLDISRDSVVENKKEVCYICQEAIVKTMTGLDEQSATGMFEARGVLFEKVPIDSSAARGFGLQQWDLIIGIDHMDIQSVSHFAEVIDELPNDIEVSLKVWRNQKEHCITYTPQAYTKHKFHPVPMG